MFASDIGMNHVEEINIVRNGANYGWMRREGIWENGRVFAADLAEMKKADDGIPQTVAPIEEVQLYVRDADGNRMGVSMRELVDLTMGASISRVDLHISRTGDGELVLTSRQDGSSYSRAGSTP